MHRYPAIRLAVAVAIALAAPTACSRFTETPPVPAPPLPLAGKPLLINTATGPVPLLHLEVADSPEERARGLMGRTSLAPDAGMLFLSDEPTSNTFWMKDTTIPLSIAFVGADGRIVGMLDMPPCPAEPCPKYAPDADYIAAIEMNQGWFEEHGVRIGDELETPIP